MISRLIIPTLRKGTRKVWVICHGVPLVPPKSLMASKDRVNDKWQSRNQDDAAAAAAAASA